MKCNFCNKESKKVRTAKIEVMQSRLGKRAKFLSYFDADKAKTGMYGKNGVFKHGYFFENHPKQAWVINDAEDIIRSEPMGVDICICLDCCKKYS